jgi:hypothetical protein
MDGEERAEREGEQHSTTDAATVGDDIAKLDSAAWGKTLAAFEEKFQEKHREANQDAGAALAECQEGKCGKGQVGAEVLQFVVDVETADTDHYGRCGGQKRSNDGAADEDNPEDNQREAGG